MPQQYRWKTFDAVSLLDDYLRFRKSSAFFTIQHGLRTTKCYEACHGLAVKWAQRIHNNPNEPAIDRVQAVVDAFASATTTQFLLSDVYRQLAHLPKTYRTLNEALSASSKVSGLQFNAIYSFGKPPMATAIAKTVSDLTAKASTKSTYYFEFEMIEVEDGKSAGHAAMMHVGKVYRFFDAAIGEIEVDWRRLEHLFNDVLDHHKELGSLINKIVMYDVHHQR